MKRKIFFNLCLISIITVVFSILLTTVVMYSNFYNDFKKDVKAEGENMANALSLDGKGQLTELLAQLKPVDVRITYISSNGTVLYDSVASAESMENHLSRPEVQSALKSSRGEAERLSNTLSQKTFYYAVRLSNGNVLRTSNTVHSVYAAVFSSIPWMLGTVILVLIIAIYLARYLTKRIVAPINEVDLDNPEQNTVYDELSPLVRKIEKQKKMISEQIEKLRTEQMRFTAITSNMREGLIVVDKNAVVLACNKAAYQILGVKKGAVEKENIISLNRSRVIQDAVKTALEGRRFEEIFPARDKQFQLIANAVLDEAEVTGAVLLLLDVTEKLERDRLRREFSANVSHELKTPLTSICGSAEILTNGLVSPGDVPRFSGMILDEAKRLIQLVDDVINLSKLDEVTNKKTEMEPVDLFELAKKTAERLTSVAEKSGVTLSVSGEKSEIKGVKSVLEEIIFNLTDNAIKYNKQDGTIDIAVTGDGDTVKLSVKDSGIGIADEDKERIFERFYRADKSHSGAIPGTGLGLSIVKHGAALHGAEIKLKSKKDVGTEISILFHK